MSVCWVAKFWKKVVIEHSEEEERDEERSETDLEKNRFQRKTSRSERREGRGERKEGRENKQILVQDIPPDENDPQ